MMRILNLIVIAALIASAIGVYSIKYQSTMQAERVAKLRRQIDAEHTTIGTLRAEWAFLSQPQRVQSLADQHTDLKPMAITQLVRWSDVPDRPPQQDGIGDKLAELGLDPAALPKTLPAKTLPAKTLPTKTGPVKIGAAKPAPVKTASIKPAAAKPASAKPVSATPAAAKPAPSLTALLARLLAPKAPVMPNTAKSKVVHP